MKITSKGQITIPIEIRETLGLLANTEVEFVMKNNVVYLKKKEASHRGARLIEKMKGKGTVKMTTDEIMALTRGK